MDVQNCKLPVFSHPCSRRASGRVFHFAACALVMFGFSFAWYTPRRHASNSISPPTTQPVHESLSRLDFLWLITCGQWKTRVRSSKQLQQMRRLHASLSRQSRPLGITLTLILHRRQKIVGNHLIVQSANVSTRIHQPLLLLHVHTQRSVCQTRNGASLLAPSVPPSFL